MTNLSQLKGEYLHYIKCLTFDIVPRYIDKIPKILQSLHDKFIQAKQ